MMSLAEMKTRLRRAKMPAAGQPSREFLPQRCLRELLTIQEVSTVLSDPIFELPDYKVESTANTVCTEGPRIFSIILELNLEPHLGRFITYECLDLSLPLTEARLLEVIPDDAESFVKRQWDYLPYQFQKGQYQRRVQDERILPYMEQTKIGGGGYSSVFKVLIHPDYQNVVVPAPSNGVYLVRKEIHLLNHGVRAEDEAELLFLLGSLRHKNIVELLLSYTQGGLPNLLFHPADLDLHDFLLLQTRAKEFEENTTILKAMHGLSSGLAYLHDFRSVSQKSGEPITSKYGYHHDIKPRNVLVRQTDFVLADFGLSRVKDMEEDTKTEWKDSTFEYGAPECRDPQTFAPGKVGRALDIWSLACVFSEVAVYMEAGADGVLQFRDQRLVTNTYGMTRCFHNNERLIPTVVRFLANMEEQTSSVVHKDLINVIRAMFAINPHDRPRADVVEADMARVTVRAFVQALTQCIDNCIEDTVGSTDFNIYQTRLRLERDRLLAWAGVVGLIPIHGHIGSFNQSGPALAPDLIHTLQSAIDELGIDRRFDSIKRDHDFVISTLHQTNNGICSHFSDDIKGSVDEMFAILSTKTTEPRSLQRIESAAIGENSVPYEDVGAIAAMKYMSILLSKEPPASESNGSVDASLIRRDSVEDDLEARPQTYWYSYGYRPGEEMKVLIEWKGYGTAWTKDVNSEEFERIGNSTFATIRELVRMLKRNPRPVNFRVLDCLGAFHDAKRREFGIVYRFPTQVGVCVRLHSLLRRHGTQKVFPDPGQRLALAKALVTAVHTFHVSGWVHKNFNSYNVLFFHDSPTGFGDLDFRNPYIVGFNHSRRDGPYEYTEGAKATMAHQEYQHPTYRMGSTAFQKSFDYYSLGLVLLEIGTWNSLSNIYGPYPTHSPSDLRQIYIEFCDCQLRMLMGPTFMEVTKECLQSNTGSDEDGLSIHIDFQRVMRKLHSCMF